MTDDMMASHDEPHPLALLGASPEVMAWAQAFSHDTLLCRVVEVQRDHVTVHDGRGIARGRVPHALQRALAAAGDALAVGDWVQVARGPDHAPASAEAETPTPGPAPGPGVEVRTRMPPRNQIARRVLEGRDKVTRAVIVSNIDTALLTMGLDGDFNLRRLQRYLTMARAAQVAAVVVLTKADLAPDAAARLAAVQALLPPDIPALALDGTHPAAATALSPWLRPGQTLVLLGSSGAGKSTLTNTLCAEARQDTGPIREADGRGRHTTTVRTLHVTRAGGCIIDTPGLRAVRLDVDDEALRAVHADITGLAQACRFRDCRHKAEPGCAVRDAVDPARLQTWHKLQREAERDSLSVLERQRQLATWKARSRAARARQEHKRS